MNWYLHVIQNYSTFNGRAHREEYWMFTLMNIIITIALALICSLLKPAGIIILMIYIIAMVIPNTAVTARRLHDIGHSGWMQLINLIPWIGGFILPYFLCKDSSPGENEYGPNPKQVAA